VLEKFLYDVVLEGSSPDDRLVVVFDEKSHGYDVEFFEAFHGDDLVFPDADLPAVEPQHFRNTRPVNVDVQKAHPLAACGEAERQVHRYRAFAHAALAGKDHQGPADLAQAFLE
jgi:hypothetical protein